MIKENNIWIKCTEELSKVLSEKEMRTWIKPLGVKYNESGINLLAPNKFMKDEVEKNFLDKIMLVINQIHSNLGVELSVESKVIPDQITETPRGFRTNLNKEMTFDTFVEGKSNQLAKAACLSVINEPGMFNPLYIYGGVGLGKTHLLHSIGNMLSKANKKVVYLHSEKFVQNMVTALRNSQMEEFKKFYRNLDVLLIDDIQFFAGKERSQEEFFHTFNALFEYKKQVVLIIDKDGLYDIKELNTPIVVLRQSPKINLQRLAEKLKPAIIIADGSNYKSYIENWKATCKNLKIPFWTTYNQGAYILN